MYCIEKKLISTVSHDLSIEFKVKVRVSVLCFDVFYYSPIIDIFLGKFSGDRMVIAEAEKQPWIKWVNHSIKIGWFTNKSKYQTVGFVIALYCVWLGWDIYVFILIIGSFISYTVLWNSYQRCHRCEVKRRSCEQGLLGQHGAHLGPTGHCYLGFGIDRVGMMQFELTVMMLHLSWTKLRNETTNA